MLNRRNIELLHVCVQIRRGNITFFRERNQILPGETDDILQFVSPTATKRKGMNVS